VIAHHGPAAHFVEDTSMLEIGLRRWPDEPSGGEHEIAAVHVRLPPRDDPDDDRFAIDFTTSGGHTLRVRLRVEHMESLGQCLPEAAASMPLSKP
jgi:hypothetical protein